MYTVERHTRPIAASAVFTLSLPAYFPHYPDSLYHPWLLVVHKPCLITMKKSTLAKRKSTSTPSLPHTLPYILGLSVASPVSSTPLLCPQKSTKAILIHSRKGSLPPEEEKNPLHQILFRQRKSVASAFSGKRGSLLQPPGSCGKTTPWKHWLAELRTSTEIHHANGQSLSQPLLAPAKSEPILDHKHKVVIRMPQAEPFSFASRDTAELSTSMDKETETMWRLSETCGSTPQPTVSIMQPWRKYVPKKPLKRRCKPGSTFIFTRIHLRKSQI